MNFEGEAYCAFHIEGDVCALCGHMSLSSTPMHAFSKRFLFANLQSNLQHIESLQLSVTWT